MWTYLQRWQVVNCLYHFQMKRGGVRWVEEHDLIAWIGGADLHTQVGPDTWIIKIRACLTYFFFGVRNHNDLYTKIRNVINECEDKDVNWITRTKGTDHISDYLNLTARGREVYAYSHLIGRFFGNYYVKWVTTGFAAWFLLRHLNIVIH